MVRALDLRSTGRGLKSYSGQKLHNNRGKVVHTYVPLSPSSIIWVDDTCGLTACTPESALGPMLISQRVWEAFTFLVRCV